MIESFIISLREGIEISLVLGILVAYLRKVGRASLLSSVYLGLALAIVGSIAGAVLLVRLGIDQESLEGYFMLAAAFFVITMVIWMWIAAKRIKGEIEQRVDTIISSKSSWRAHAGIFGFSFLMILREGIETAIFLQAVAFSTGAWRSFSGTAAGIGLAVVFAILFIRGSVRIDTGRFLRVTAITLLIFTLQLIVNAFHEFYEYGVFAANPAMMGILGPVVQNNVLFILAIVSIPALMMVIPGRSGRSGGARRWQLGAAMAALTIVLFLGVGEIFSSSTEKDFSAQQLAIPSSGIFEIPIERVSDGSLHRFSISDSGLELRFFVLRTSVGKFATAFDACYACYSYGRYYLRGGGLVCSQCDAPVPLSRLHQIEETPADENNTGSMEGNGCAPIYLPSRMQAGKIDIRVADLRKQRKYFDIGPEPH